MARRINRVKLFVKDTINAHSIEKIVIDELNKNNFEINDDSFDLIISIGGDGTFLKMLHQNNFNDDVYYASINAGSLGFLSSVDGKEVEYFINSLNSDSFNVRGMPLLNTKVYNGTDFVEYLSLNEFTIRKNDFSTLKADILVNNQLLDNYSGDGLIIGTTIGSTGYSLALGGAIIDNDIRAFSITAIAPINNKVYKSLINPLILSSNKKVTIIPEKENLCFLSDGYIYNKSFDKVECYISDKTIKCIFPNNYNYINKLKSKIIDNGE